MKELANIHIFKCGRGRYFYDVNKNAIVEIEEKAYNYLQKNLEINYIKQNDELTELINKGYLSSNRPLHIKHPCCDYLDEILGNNIIKICLQVTQKCNFRCNYCVYSGTYYNREHSNSEMTWETAKKSIDFLIEHSFDTDIIDIGFYGGEPLLRYNFIVDCIDYALSQAEGKKVTFSITTNGSLLTEEMVEEFLKSGVNVVISLDGPKEVQNRNRCFINGEGSFDTVYENIEKLLKKYPRFKDILSIHMVVDQSYDMASIIQFIQEDLVIKDIEISAATISDEWKKSPIQPNEVFIEQWKYGEFRYMLHMLGRLKDSNKDLSLWKEEFLKIKKFAEDTKREIRPLQKNEHHSGPCIPGQLRLFINAKGLFYPCERVSESTNEMVIGDIENGFNLDKVKKLLNIGALTKEECKSCYAIRNCLICATTVDDGGNISRERKMEACRDSKYIFEDILKNLCALKRCGYRIKE